MAKQFDNTNRGALFRVKNPTSDKSPSHTGTLNVEGTVFKLSAWVREAKSGEKFFSLAVTLADDQPKQDREERRRQDDRDLDSDAIPF